MEVLGFSFDPRCPWCYQTSRWALRLQTLGIIELKWSVFSLELNNFEGDKRDFPFSTSKSAPALRTSLLVRDSEGESACGDFYAAIGQRYFYGLEDLREESTIRSALSDAGLDPDLYTTALNDDSTWEAVAAEHQRLVDEVGAFGVPTIRLDGGQGPGMFGPVIQDVPPDDEARELLEHVLWLIRYQTFYELKSGRANYPDLPYIKKALAERTR
jgi:protein-disulfide isomerase-like protein with CxxC motif